MALLFADILAVLLLQAGGFAMMRRARRAAAMLAVATIGTGALLACTAGPADAQASPTARADVTAVKATSKVTFAYVVTGDATADDASRRGIVGLCAGFVARVCWCVERRLLGPASLANTRLHVCVLHCMSPDLARRDSRPAVATGSLRRLPGP
jgi:hypothetical protein